MTSFLTSFSAQVGPNRHLTKTQRDAMGGMTRGLPILSNAYGAFDYVQAVSIVHGDNAFDFRVVNIILEWNGSRGEAKQISMQHDKTVADIFPAIEDMCGQFIRYRADTVEYFCIAQDNSRQRIGPSIIINDLPFLEGDPVSTSTVIIKCTSKMEAMAEPKPLTAKPDPDDSAKHWNVWFSMMEEEEPDEEEVILPMAPRDAERWQALAELLGKQIKKTVNLEEENQRLADEVGQSKEMIAGLAGQILMMESRLSEQIASVARLVAQ